MPKGVGEISLADLARIPEAGRENACPPALQRMQRSKRDVTSMYALTPEQRQNVNRRVSAILRKKYGFSGLGQDTGSTDWVATINDIGETYYKLKPYLDFFADHPILSISAIILVVGSILGVYSYLGAGLKATEEK